MILCRSALVLEFETLTETILHAHRGRRFIPGVQGGDVACATEYVRLGYI